MSDGEGLCAERLAAALCLPGDVALVCGPIAAMQGELLPPEAQAIDHAVPKRRREFTAGRTAARRACARLGVWAGALPVAADRTPVWPEGVVGSISHSDLSCAVLAGRRGRWRSVGIDVETIGRVTPDLWPLLFSPEECERLSGGDDAFVTGCFCLKEAFFKLQYGLTGQIVDPRQLGIFGDAREGFRLCTQLADERPLAVAGRIARAGDEVIAACLLPEAGTG